jgi:hypothetical protein
LSRRACHGWRRQGTRRGTRRRVWSEGPGDSARRRRAVEAHTRGSVAAKGRPQLWAEQWHAVTDYSQRYTSSVPGGCAWASAALYKCLLCRKRHDDNRQDLSSMVLAHAGYFSSAPAARKNNRTRYSDGTQGYTPGIRSMSGQKFLRNPQQDTLSGYYDGKNS